MLIFSLLFLFSNALAKEQTLCLNMIVKNEAKVIQRCLDSVKERIDYWVIVDTGSTDGTQEIIREHMRDCPGELHERAWKNWGASRTEAFELAKGKGDYLLFMDADDILEFESRFEMPVLEADMYTFWRGTNAFSYLKPQIVKGNLPWKWVGVTHEYLACDGDFSSETLKGVRYVSIDDGATHYDSEKYWKNVRLLEAGLKEEPDNSRYMFYLAESYRSAGEPGKALEWYQKRIQAGGWEEEMYWSKLQTSRILGELGLPPSVVAQSYWDALAFRPHRAEAAYHLAELYNKMEHYEKAYEVLELRESIPGPDMKDSLFNEDWMSDYGLLFQRSICSYYVGHYREALEACDHLLTLEALPESWRAQAEINRAFALLKLQAEGA